MITTYKGVSLYYNPQKPQHELGVDQFKSEVIDTFPDIVWKRAHEQSPWHLQARVNGYLIDAWPSAHRACISGTPSVHGASKIRELILGVLDMEPKTKETVDLIDD